MGNSERGMRNPRFFIPRSELRIPHSKQMVIGTLRVRLLVRQARSLKDKRQVARSILDRLRGQFDVAISEVATQDDHQQLTLGVAAVGPEMEPVRGVLTAVQNALRTHPIAEYLGGELTLGHEVV